MYHFNQTQADDQCRLELNGIKLLVDGYTIKQDKHYLKNPANAIAFFDVNGGLYGISNRNGTYLTAEDFYDSMQKQLDFFV